MTFVGDDQVNKIVGEHGPRPAQVNAPGFDSSDPSEKADPEEAWAVGRTRRIIGYVLGSIAVAVVVVLLFFAYGEIASFGASFPPKLLQDPAFAFKLLVIKLCGHGIVTIAAVYFGYQLIRAAERFALPHWMADSKPETVGLLLGVRSPLDGAAEFAGKVLKTSVLSERK